MDSQHLTQTTTKKPLLGNKEGAYEQEDVPSYPPSLKDAPVRRDAHYKESYWNYQRIQSLPTDSQDEIDKRGERIEKLKGEVWNLLNAQKEVFQQLKLVDAISQLGVGYHFEKEVHDFLTYVQGVTSELISEKSDDVLAISQLFRVLRSYGYEVSQDVFKSFREDNGGFKTSLYHNHKGMLSLYEASFLQMVDEDIMDEARKFTSKYLNELLNGNILDPHFKLQLEYALELPIHWRLARLHARWFIDTYADMDCMNPTILEFAKLDYNAVQNIYKNELKDLSRWWKNLSLVDEKMSFRHRVVECFYFAIGTVSETKFHRCRVALAKVYLLATILDDCYDVYGTLDELELFTAAIKRWDASIIKELPKCMNMCLLATFNTINDLGYQIFRDKGVEVTHFLKRGVVDLCNGYNQEAKWYHKGYMPSTKEYIDNGFMTGIVPITSIIAYCTSEDITEKALEQYEIYPDIIRPPSIIIRLLDDLATEAKELARGDTPKSITCYMFENGVSESTARERIKEIIIEQWKALNSYRVPNSIYLDTYKSILLGYPRTTHVIYKYGDGFGDPKKETEDNIKSLIIEPVVI